MTTLDTLRSLLSQIERTSLHDSAGILTPQGIDAQIEARAIRKAIARIEDEARREAVNDCNS